MAAGTQQDVVMKDNTVYRLPTKLFRLRETDRLVKAWADIQRG